MRKLIILAAALVLVAAMAATSIANQAMEDAKAFTAGADADNGKLVYLAGFNLKVERSQFMGGPQWLQMHGGGCASCHGPGGRGGRFPLQCDLRSPAVDFESLADIDKGYTTQNLRTALEKSRTPKGEALDPCMPRWYLNKTDYRDLIGHLLKLSDR